MHTRFRQKQIICHKNGKVIRSGKRNWPDGLWDVPFPQQDALSIDYIISRDRSKIELAQYLHRCAFLQLY